MSDREVDFKSLVEQNQTGERGYTHLTIGKYRDSAGSETKEFSALLSIKSIDEQSWRIKAIASTGDIDRYEEIILPEAFRESLPVFMKNPIVLAAHQHKLSDGTSPVVANIVSASITPAGLEVIIEFHTVTRLAEEYWQLYSQKKQRALSVGFKPIPNESGFENINGKNVFVYRKVELLEISLVAVPANPNALSKSKQRKTDFLAEKIAQRQLDKDADNFAELIFTGDFDALGIPEAIDDEIDLSGESDIGPSDIESEPDYAESVKSKSILQNDSYESFPLQIKSILNNNLNSDRYILY